MKVRKNLLVLVILFLFFGFNVNAYSQWVSAGSVSFGATLWPSISVASPSVAWIAGGVTTPYVFRTTNGGGSWVSISTTGLPVKALMCIWAIDENTAYVGDGGDAAGTAGGDAAVSKTTNGGLNWTTIFNTGSGTTGFFNGIVFSRKTPSFGFAESDPPTGAGNPYYVQITTNGGVNWTLTSPPGVPSNASAMNSLVCIDNQFYGFGMNNSAQIYRTTNGGTNWGLGVLGLADVFTSGFAFNDNKLFGIASTSTSFPTIARTTDGGTTWNPVSLGGTGTSTMVSMKWITNSNTCYYAGAGAAALIFKSTNSGANWTAMTVPGGAVDFTFFDFVLVGNTATGYAISPSGTVIKLSETVTTIHSENNVIPSDFKLNQNYPNPFNPSTTINFSIPKSEFVTLKIYNILGKEVATVVNQKLEAGSYNELFEAPSDLTSGVYFYKLTAGSFTNTKKMTVLK